MTMPNAKKTFPKASSDPRKHPAPGYDEKNPKDKADANKISKNKNIKPTNTK